MARPESLNIDKALAPVKPAVPERLPNAKPSSVGDVIRSYAHKAANAASGGALDTTNEARKNMNYYHEDDGK